MHDATAVPITLQTEMQRLGHPSQY